MLDWHDLKTGFKQWRHRYRNPLKLFVLMLLVYIPFGPTTDPDCSGGHKKCPIVIENTLQAILFYLSYPLIFTLLIWVCLIKAKHDEDNNRFW